MEKKRDKKYIIHNLRLINILLLLLYSMMQKISVLEFICSSRIIPLFFLALGGLLFCCDFFGKRRMFESKYIILPVLFIIATVVSALANIKYGIYTNAVIIVYLVIEYAVLYPFEGYKETAKRDFKVIGYTVTLFSLILSVYTYASYFLCFEYYYNVDEYRLIEQGYQSSYRRAWGCYYETNWQGIMALIVIYLCVYLFLHTSRKWLKAVNVVNIIFQIGILVLTGSRSTMLSLYISAAILGWYLSFCFLRKFDKNIFIQHLLIIAGFTCFLISYGVLYAVKTVLPIMQKITQDNVSMSMRIALGKEIKNIYKINNIDVIFTNPLLDGSMDEQKEFELEKIERLDIESKDDKFNGRVHIWKDGIKIFAKTPLFGTSPGNLAEYTKVNMPDACRELLEGTSLRNGYIDMLIKGGIAAAVPIFLFLFLCAKRLWLYQKKMYSHRTDLGLILACITAVLVFILASSDLFYYRSSLNYLFIIFLGYGMYLIDCDLLNRKDTENLFVCDTPYQVVNAVNCVSGSKGGLRSDIYIYHQFSSAEKIAENLKQTKLFDTVVVFEKYKNYPKVIRKLIRLFQVFAPWFTLKHHSLDKLEDKNYKTIYVSFFTSFTDSVKLVNPQAEFVQYEDGIGSYIHENLENAFRSGFFALINKLLLNGRLSYNISTIYLNHPEQFKGTYYGQVKKLSSADNINILKTVFDYIPNEQYREHKFIYLTQPLKETAAGNSAEKIESEIISAFNDKVLVRVHPRQNAADYKQCMVDTQNNLWELECAEQITDSHVLIGAFSTAQFTPKMLFDKEPTVIFTYKLYGNAFKNVDETVEMLRSMYRNPEKVIVAEDINRLSDFINKDR